jgi:hypothetical protein
MIVTRFNLALSDGYSDCVQLGLKERERGPAVFRLIVSIHLSVRLSFPILATIN